MSGPLRACALRVAGGILLAVGLGVLEMGLRIADSANPSVARRAWGLLAYAAVLYGALGALAMLAGEALASFRSRSRPGESALPSLVASGSALALLALLLPLLGPWLSPRGTLARGALFVGVLGAAGLVGALALRIATRTGLERPSGRRRVGLVLVGVVALVAGVVLAARARPTRATSVPPGAGPNVVLVVVDTLRRDVHGCYGDAGGLTPAADGLAGRGAVFERALAPAPWTMPSVASILTGLYPREHGCVDFDRLLPELPASLPGAFRAAGYHTRAAVGNLLLSHEKGFAREFDSYDVYGYELETRLVGARLVEELMRLRGPLRRLPRTIAPVLLPTGRFPFVRVHLAPGVLDPHLNARLFREPLPDDRPLFLYVHYTAPHRPYVMHLESALAHSPAFEERNLERLQELYRREVAYTDRALTELLAELERRGVLDGAVVAYTSDHGEEFLEHGGWHHGTDLYDEVVGVPLVLAGPGIATGSRIPAPVSLVDLAPTLLELCGIPAPAGMAGRSLVPELRGAAGPAAGVYSETTSNLLTPERESFAVVHDGWKLVRTRTTDSEGGVEWIESLAFDLDADPREERPLDELPAALVEELEGYRAVAPPDALDERPSALDRMRALGYGG